MFGRGFFSMFLTLLLASPAWAATYYTSTASPGSSCTTALDPSGAITPAEMVSLACMSSGDTVIFLDGTYTTAISWTSLLPSGTSSAQTIARSLNKWGAVIAQTGTQSSAEIALTQRSYVTIDGFDIDASSQGQNASSTCIALVLSSAVTQNGIQLLNNHCTGYRENGFSDSSTGTPVATYDNTLVQGNVIEDPIAPYYDGDGLPHGMYLRGANNIITRNTVESPAGSGTLQSGSAIQVRVKSTNTVISYNLMRVNGTSGVGVYLDGPVDGVQVHHNTMRALNGSGNSCVTMQAGAKNSHIYQNVCDDFDLYFIWQRSSASTGNKATNNISITGGSGTIRDDRSPATLVAVDNLTGVATSNFTDRANGDYSLVAGAATLIDSGTAISGQSYNGSAPDLGAHERLTYSSATVNENFLDVTLGQNISAHNPVRAGATSEWTVLRNAVARTTTAVTKLTGSDSIIRITFNGAACDLGQTWTVTHTLGTATDSSYVGGPTGYNQPVSAFTAQPVTSTGCGTAPPTPPAGVTISYAFDENAGTSAADSEVGDGAQNGTLTNTPSWIAPGKKGTSAVGFTSASTQHVAIPYGSGVNPSTTSFTDCMWVKPDVASNSRIFFGADYGTNQRYYLGFIGSSLSMGIQSSPYAANVDFPVSDVYLRACVRMDSGTDTATLFMNGTKGSSSQSVKAYSSYALASDLRLGSNVTTGDAFSGGVTIDEFRHYPSPALSDADVLLDFTSSEPPSPPATGTISQVAHQWNRLRQTSGGAAETYGAVSATMPVMVGGSVSLMIQTDCTAANCSSFGARLYFNVDGGTFSAVPDTMGASQVEFFTYPDVDVFQGVSTCCLSGALTANHGSTNTAMAAVPINDLTQNSSVVQRYVIRTGATTSGQTICFKAYDQNGNALSSYTPSAGACMTVVGVAGAMGF